MALVIHSGRQGIRQPGTEIFLTASGEHLIVPSWPTGFSPWIIISLKTERRDFLALYNPYQCSTVLISAFHIGAGVTAFSVTAFSVTAFSMMIVSFITLRIAQRMVPRIHRLSANPGTPTGCSKALF